MSGVKKQGDNTLAAGFQVRFVERVYDGAPRWGKADYFKHVTRVERLDREESVRDKIRDAHKARQDAFATLDTCVNPDCADRFQQLRLQHDWGRDPKLDDRLRGDLLRLARGEAAKLSSTCPVCSGRQHVFPCAPLAHKWVYMLKDEGRTLTPVLEIHVEGPASGAVHPVYDKQEKRFKDKGQLPYPGYLAITPSQARETWHFFLSPVRLGPDALDLLARSPELMPKLARERDKYDPAGKGVPILADLQPWAPTVKRKFGADQLRKRPQEIIPLVDPFTWAALAADFDYVPILGAQQELIRNPEEQAKAFIAAVLHSSMARRQVSDDPPKWVEDPWDVKDDTVDPPAGYQGSGDIAGGWMDRYKATLEYLTQQLHEAAYRVVFGVRFNLGHRIVETACQERKDEPGFLAHGVLHWLHVLKEMLLCQPGEAFVTWLAEGQDASERIPQRNVLGGRDLGQGSRVHTEAPGAALQLYALFNPVVIAVSKRSDKAAAEVVDHLKQIGVSASSPGVSEVKLSKDTVVSILDSALDKYLEKLPERARVLGEELTLAKQYGATSWKARLAALENVTAFEDGIALLIGLKAYIEEAGAYDTPYDKYGKTKGRIEYPFKVVDFLGKQARRAVKSTLTGEGASVLKKVEEGGAKAVASLSADEFEVLLANRSVRACRGLATGARVLAGPVGLVLGGADLVAEGGKTIDEWQGGDPGACVGHALMAGAAVCAIAVAAAETAALVTGAATAAWAGPVGWIAAGLLLLGALVLSFCAKNDLEKFAQHCWLGPDYGSGDWDDETGKSWMANKPWPWLRYIGPGTALPAADRWQRQRLALLRMISGFKTCCHAGSYCGGQIYPTFLGNSSAFEIEVDVSPSEQAGGKKETYRAIVWPASREAIWIGGAPADDSRLSVSPHKAGEKVESITVEARPRGFGSPVDYQLRVRLCLDGPGASFGSAGLCLPASGNWVVNNPSGYSEQNSAGVD